MEREREEEHCAVCGGLQEAHASGDLDSFGRIFEKGLPGLWTYDASKHAFVHPENGTMKKGKSFEVSPDASTVQVAQDPARQHVWIDTRLIDAKETDSRTAGRRRDMALRIMHICQRFAKVFDCDLQRLFLVPGGDDQTCLRLCGIPAFLRLNTFVVENDDKKGSFVNATNSTKIFEALAELFGIEHKVVVANEVGCELVRKQFRKDPPEPVEGDAYPSDLSASPAAVATRKRQNNGVEDDNNNSNNNNSEPGDGSSSDLPIPPWTIELGDARFPILSEQESDDLLDPLKIEQKVADTKKQRLNVSGQLSDAESSSGKLSAAGWLKKLRYQLESLAYEIHDPKVVSAVPQASAFFNKLLLQGVLNVALLMDAPAKYQTPGTLLFFHCVAENQYSLLLLDDTGLVKPTADQRSATYVGVVTSKTKEDRTSDGLICMNPQDLSSESAVFVKVAGRVSRSVVGLDERFGTGPVAASFSDSKLHLIAADKESEFPLGFATKTEIVLHPFFPVLKLWSMVRIMW